MNIKVLKALRVSRGLSQHDLADLIGVNKSSVGHWEAGRCMPGTDNLMALCAAFHVDPEYLLGKPPRIRWQPVREGLRNGS